MRGLAGELRDEFRGVILLLGLLNAALEVPAERALAPGAIHGVRDWCEGGAGTVRPRAAQERVEVDGQRAVSAHRVPEDRLAGEVLAGKRG